MKEIMYLHKGQVVNKKHMSAYIRRKGSLFKILLCTYYMNESLGLRYNLTIQSSLDFYPCLAEGWNFSMNAITIIMTFELL